MKKILIIVALVAGLMVSAQVKIGGTVETINTINANSILELESTNKGVLFPRVTLTGTTDATTVGSQVAGMTIYNTATTSDVSPGMYTSNGAKWVRLGTSTTARTNQVATSSYDWTNSNAGLVKFYEFTSGTGPINLPSAATYIDQIIYVRNNTGASINFGSTDGVNRPKGVAALVASGALQIWSDGTNWHNIAGRN